MVRKYSTRSFIFQGILCILFVDLLWSLVKGMWILQFGCITASDFHVDCGQTLIEVPTTYKVP